MIGQLVVHGQLGAVATVLPWLGRGPIASHRPVARRGFPLVAHLPEPHLSPTRTRGLFRLGMPGIVWFQADAPATADDDAAGAEPAALPGFPEPPPPAPTRGDEHLVRAAQRGDLEAFNLLVLRYERAVFNVCLRLLRDVASAEDVTQESFVKAWQSIASVRGDTIRPWLFRIATNRCYDLLRVRGRRPASSLDAEPFEIEPVWSTQSPSDETPEAHALRRELSIHIERALSSLPEDQRTVVLLADVQGCDYHEVAAATGAALGTVKSRLSRGRARLRQILQDDPEVGERFDRYSRHYDEQGEATRS